VPPTTTADATDGVDEDDEDYLFANTWHEGEATESAALTTFMKSTSD
jgi:hypothetical protein